jgi:hypothetical protein
MKLTSVVLITFIVSTTHNLLFSSTKETQDNRIYDAAGSGDLETIRRLIPKNKNNHYLALCNAIINGHLAVVEYLIGHGVPIDSSLIPLALHYNQQEIYLYLLKTVPPTSKINYLQQHKIS